MHKVLIILVAFSFGFQSCSQINLGKLQEVSDAAEDVLFGEETPSLTNDEVIAGLKQALEKGTEKSVSLASATDGFYKNSALKIPFPEDAIRVKEVAEQYGLGSQVEKFELTLNRAAEEASKEAVSIFVDAVTQMTVADGFAILKGDDNAATIYLNEKTNAILFQNFSPIVDAAIQKVELTKYWEPLISKYNAMSFIIGGEPVEQDLNKYITEKAIDGLFVHIAEEEKNIRENPLARVTELLERVFGSL